jgi:hypothetical protein
MAWRKAIMTKREMAISSIGIGVVMASASAKMSKRSGENNQQTVSQPKKINLKSYISGASENGVSIWRKMAKAKMAVVIRNINIFGVCRNGGRKAKETSKAWRNESQAWRQWRKSWRRGGWPKNRNNNQEREMAANGNNGVASAASMKAI